MTDLNRKVLIIIIIKNVMQTDVGYIVGDVL